MSASPTGPVRPARLAGFILLGVAVVAVGLGIFALADSAAGQTTSSGPTSQVTAPETITTTTAKPTTAAPTTTTTTPPTSTSYPSGQTTTVITAPPTDAGPPAPPPIQVRVYNNGTIQGLAARAAAELQNAGFDVVAVGPYPSGIIPTSTVYYTPGAPGEQDTAQAIGNKFGMRVLPRFPGIADASPGVIVIITNSFKG